MGLLNQKLDAIREAPYTMTPGQILIDAVIQAGAIRDVEKIGNSNLFLWSANAAEQIEAAIDRLGYRLERKPPARYPIGTHVNHPKHGHGVVFSYEHCDELGCGVDFYESGRYCVDIRELEPCDKP